MKHLVLLGAGHAHVHVLEGLAARKSSNKPSDVRVTLIAPFDEQLYSGMVPGFVAGHYTLDECVIGLKRLIEASGVQFIEGNATRIDADDQTLHLSNGQTIAYDVLSLNTGAGIDLEKIEALMPGARKQAMFVRPMQVFVKLWPQVLALATSRPLHLAVVGAGAAGLELAMAAAHTLRGRANASHAPGSRITLVTGGLPPAQSYPPSVQRRVLRALKRLQITVVEESCVAINEGELVLGSGAKLPCDVPLLAIGVHAPGWLANSGLMLDEKGFLAVDHFQQSISHPLVFAVGDVASRIDTPHSRSGVYAVHAGPPLLRNLLAVVGSKSLTPYAVPERTLNLLSCGGRYAIAAWGKFSVEGAWVWRLKDRIDRKFVRRYSD